MWPEDLELLACPRTGRPLELADGGRHSDDGEILEGTLLAPDGRSYPITNGIPRFTEDTGYNASWDYKWTELDGGAGHNYRIIDRDDPAYAIHDLFDRNDHGGQAHRNARGGVALDFGCGIGQYSVRLLREHEPRRLVSLDLTRGVDVFRSIVQERYPELQRRLLIVQGNALSPPLARGSFDYIFSLGVLMHTGSTIAALRQAAELLRPGGHLNVWLYSAQTLPTQAREPGRNAPRGALSLLPLQLRESLMARWIELFRRLDPARRMKVIRAVSSRAWYLMTRVPVFRIIPRSIFPTVEHPDHAYRLINNYDGYVNEWSDTWSEHEILPVLMDSGLVIMGLSSWRLGVWAVKDTDFRPSHIRG